MENKENIKPNLYKIDSIYDEIMSEIIDDGFIYEDPNRKGVKRKQIPFATIYANDTGGFIVSTRKSYFKGAVAELLLFLQGKTDIRDYQKSGVSFWTKDWERFKNDRIKTGNINTDKEEDLYYMGKIYPYQYQKQYYVFDKFKENPYRTDLIVNSWQEDDLKDMCLPPCHFSYQFVKSQYGFNIIWSQRSTDFLLGTPMNIQFYYLMGRILEIWSGHKFDSAIGNLHNVHIYDNQEELANKVLDTFYNGRYCPLTQPDYKVEIDSSKWEINKPFGEFIQSVKIEDFKLKGYKPILTETVEMLTYNK